jgi:membrane protease YdiL (CAAX protease family)
VTAPTRGEPGKGARERAASPEASGPRAPNRDLLLPYLLPYFVYVGIASFLGDWTTLELNFALRLVATPLALAWAWRWYAPLRGPRPLAGSIGVGAAAGLVGTALWAALRWPFAGEGEPWVGAEFVLHLAAAGLVVPVFEELLMRGYVLRFAVQWERVRSAGIRPVWGHTLDRETIGAVEPGAWTRRAVVASSVVFALGHTPDQYPAALAYGLLMAGLWIVRKDLISCIVAHAVTNVTLAILIRQTGYWGLW